MTELSNNILSNNILSNNILSNNILDFPRGSDYPERECLDTRKVKLAEYLALGYKPGEIAEILGVSVAWVRLNRKEASVAKLVSELQNEALEAAKKKIIHNTTTAADKVVELLECKDPKVQLAAAKDLLDRAGIKEKEQPIVNTINNFNFSNMSLEELKIAIMTRIRNLELDDGF